MRWNDTCQSPKMPLMEQGTGTKSTTSARKVGVWLIGAAGGIGSTVALGLAAARLGRESCAGMVTELADFATLGLVQTQDIQFGGHEIRSETLVDAITQMHDDANLFDLRLIDACRPELVAFQRDIVAGTLYGASEPVRAMANAGPVTESSPWEAVERLSSDIRAFRTKHDLDRVVVIHTASAEPAARSTPAHASYAALSKALKEPGNGDLPASSLYALAAVEADAPYVNCTPSLGIGVPAIQDRAREKGLPFMGNDGKTGESLVKSFLAPMFVRRNLNVLSWVGQNILGNRDGQVLCDPETREAKIKSKDGLLNSLDGQNTTRRVSIDYVPSLADWKIAWDFIHFEGFLGTKMSLQFTWQGSDSVLAAPLILDLVRLADHAHRTGYRDVMHHLACFFKSPLGVDEHNYEKQRQMLAAYAERASSGDSHAVSGETA